MPGRDEKLGNKPGTLWEMRYDLLMAGFRNIEVIKVNNPGSQKFWNSIGWTVIPDVKYLYKEF